MTQIATSWLVYRLTNSALLLGIVGFSGQIPAFILTPFAGVWVDRLNRHSVLKATQFLSMLQSFALAALTFTGVINIWHIAALMMFQGIVNAFDMPARQTFVIEMIEDRNDLPNAIALNSSMLNGSRLIGPSIAGTIIAFAGEAYCFLIDGFSYLAVIGSLFLMNIRPGQRRLHESIWLELREGLEYISAFVPIRSILTLVAVLSLAGAPYSVLLPVFASAILHGGPHTLGFLSAASGLGAFASAITLVLRRTIIGLGTRMKITAFTFGVGLILFALSRSFWLSLTLMFVCGFSMMQTFAAGNTIMQTIVAEGKRGRVMSFYTLAVIGMVPFGSLLSGVLADRIGAPLTVGLGGTFVIVCAMWFARKLEHIRTVVRPIYRDLGILPEVD
jgi:MFS family permease